MSKNHIKACKKWYTVYKNKTYNFLISQSQTQAKGGNHVFDSITPTYKKLSPLNRLASALIKTSPIFFKESAQNNNLLDQKLLLQWISLIILPLQIKIAVHGHIIESHWAQAYFVSFNPKMAPFSNKEPS